ncbi:trans-sulfuration enzyme family protein [Evansella tamaricis]|uniref:PLP-dependent aspartate aminotransferase family protein n=1 Tax=Evansella tamaricis TaxID=2069301 RepID=A0ABS6JEV1_9BACI|nr:PLP-dependent aspartate aminotransferase family protein [Evansella tamaricis]MBU9712189.1 PLP-dependent aspartate aminotransferase family protein [Evansella tamaricis]
MTKEFKMNKFQSEIEKDSYICTHYGENPEDYHGAVVPPIYESSLHVFKNYETFLEAQKDEQNNYLYWRGTNPTVEIAERKLAALERGDSCKCFTSGMAAISAAILTLIRSGDHILTVGNVYGTSLKIMDYLKRKWEVEHTAIVEPSMEKIEAAIQINTKVILLESPTTMTFKLINIQEVVSLAKKHGIKTIMDNTWATPLFQKPLLMGIDVVVHSAAKYLSGHSDILAGAVISDQNTIRQLFDNEFTLFGGALAPHEAWLLIRGLRTLPIRMGQHQESGLKVSEFLSKHPAVKKVNHPGLSTSKDFQLGKEQLTGYTGTFSFELKNGSFENIQKCLNRLEIFQIGYSFGSYESLVLSENNGKNMDKLQIHGIDPGLIRLSIGLESAELLIQDLEQALAELD